MSQTNHKNWNTPQLGLNQSQIRGEWVRPQTLILLRWLAILGQSTAVFVAVQFLDLQLQLWLCICAISASAIFNLYLSYMVRGVQRLSANEALLGLGFDLCQLLVMLYLTGGLNNPFAFLLLAPITISATTLRLNATLFLEFVAILGITILVYIHRPLIFSDGTTLALPQLLVWGMWTALLIGFLFVALYARRVTVEIYSMSEALAATQMALDREHKLTLLGGVVSAAAHEMGTPLATIKMVATELEEELSHSPDLRSDATLVKEQADRLSQILKDMGRSGKQDLHIQFAPFSSVVDEAAEPHANRGKTITINANAKAGHSEKMPDFPRSPEIVHGLRNLIQNAVDFAATQVWIDLSWDAESIQFHITDDGPGFPYELIGRIGDPLIRRYKSTPEATRPEYEGMGLGLFIARSLLERSGARLNFYNATGQFKLGAALGAAVEVRWSSSAILKPDSIGTENPNTRV
ncbi:MAG: ActS/PrrB/RegB family redox-sensitive histidine kinase [Pseudomonadota bacterium]